MEDVADLLAREQDRRGPPDVARLDPVGLRLGQVDLDLDLRDLDLELGVQVDQPRDAAERLLDLRRLGPQDRQVGTEDAHDDGVAGARQDLADPLLQVGLDVAPQPRVAVHDFLDRRVGLVVVDGRDRR